jgi:hypothetical protein
MANLPRAEPSPYGTGATPTMRFLALLALAALAAVPHAGAAAVLKAGAAAVKITPALDRTVFIAGYNNNRIADSVHDDLWARALVLDDGTTRMAVVSCDLIGISNHRVRKMRARIKAVPGENVLIAATHVHSGPDTLGLWGKSQLSTGLDPVYMEKLEENVAAAVEKAAAELQPVTLSAAAGTVPDGFVHNSREAIQDKVLTALRFASGAGKTVATLVNYGGHPEVNKTKALTSDFVGPVRDAVEKELGGVAIFLNGALGGMVTPKISAHTWEEMQRVGEGVGRSAVEITGRARPVTVEKIALRRKEVTLPLENQAFKLLAGAKVLDAGDLTTDVHTEVWRVDLGPITWMTIPGEILPRPALDLKSRMPGAYKMIVALGNDELGYILHPEDFDRDLYKYERSMSVGKQTWPGLLAAAEELLR